jgi:hypothetical protein
MNRATARIMGVRRGTGNRDAAMDYLSPYAFGGDKAIGTME